MSEYPRALHQPPTGRARWINEGEPDRSLQYLAWGSRAYGRQPIPRSQHAGWTYQLLTDGQALLNGPEHAMPVRAGDLVLIGPACGSGWSGQNAEDRCKILTWIWQDAPAIESLRPRVDGWSVLRLSASEIKDLSMLHRETRREVTQSDAATPLSLRTIQNRLDVLLSRSQTDVSPPSSSDQRIEFAITWLKKHPEELSPVSALADVLRISPASLNRMFQRQLRKSVREVAYEHRMAIAREDLRNSTVSVKELALKLGYSHTNDFSRAYARHWGHPPTSECNKS